MKPCSLARVAGAALLWATATIAAEPSDQPSPGGGESKSEHQGNSAEKHGDRQTDQRGTQEAPFVIQIQQTPGQNPIGPEAKEKGGWYTRPDWWTAVFTAALFISTSGLWVFTAFLWSASKRTAERQLRAYVFAKPDRMDLALERDGNIGTLTVRYMTINTGQTPAYELSSIGELRIMPHPLPTDFVISSPEIREEDKRPFALGPHDNVFASPETPYRRLNDGEGYYLVAIITYRDAFKRSRTTKFCCHADVGQLLPGARPGTITTVQGVGFSIVGNHNDAD